MRINVGSLVIVSPYDCVFQDQFQYLERLYDKIRSDEHDLYGFEVPQSEAKRVLVLAFFIAYLANPNETFRRIAYLSRTNQETSKTLEVYKQLFELRRKQLGPQSVQINVGSSIGREPVEQPSLYLLTQMAFVEYVRDHDQSVKGKFLILFSQISTLDTDCENSLSCQITQTTLRRAVMEKRNLQRKIKDVPSEFEYRQLVENIKQSSETGSLGYSTLFLNNIQYLIGYLKSKQRQISHSHSYKKSESKQDQERNKKSLSRKLADVVSEWTKELRFSSIMVRSMQDRLFQMIREENIQESEVYCISTILKFLRYLVDHSQKYEAIYPNAFRFCVNIRTDSHELFSFKVVCLQPRIIFDRMYTFPRRDKNSKVKMILVSSTPIHKDFFVNNFHVVIQSESISSKQILQQNILAIMTSSNTFVDLKSDDFQSENQLQIQRSFGTLITELADIVNDGVVVYVSSSRYLATLLEEWRKEKILDSLSTKKYVFVESDNEQENKLNIEYYKQACDVGRGAIFFFTCRSKAANIQQLKGHYSNAVIFLGYPKLNEQDVRNKQKLQYLRRHNLKDEFLFLEEEAMRHVNKCLLNTVTYSRTERKIVLFVDTRFNSRLLPGWMDVDQGNLDITESIERSVNFNRYNNKRQLQGLIKQNIYI